MVALTSRLTRSESGRPSSPGRGVRLKAALSPNLDVSIQIQAPLGRRECSSQRARHRARGRRYLRKSSTAWKQEPKPAEQELEAV